MPETMVETSSPAVQFEQRLRDKTAKIGVVGLGYVGLPLLRAYFQAGFPVIGFDVDQSKIDLLQKGESYLKHLGTDFVRELAKSDRFVASSDPQALADADAIILCVPTPLGGHGEPDMSYIHRSTEMVAKVLRKGQLIS
ncbi:MAG: nucleotide sugar dehydrogenase, partial [Myxococcales bacterium]|nr:nucleotide sugar dehydrogenase [Myxococcales bacterium]